jgi:hypothetical protein
MSNEQQTPSKKPWWFAGVTSPRTALILGVWWLLFAVIGVAQFTNADDSSSKWLATIQVIGGLLLGVQFLCSAAYSRRMARERR